MRRLFSVSITAVLFASMSGTALAQTTAPPTPTAETVHKMTAEVVRVQGTSLVVKLPSGEMQVFNVSPQRRFNIDGTPIGVQALQPGTMLTATYTSTPPKGSPVTTATGKVWFVDRNTVLITHPDGNSQKYTVPDSFQFIVDGRPATVHDLRPGMNVTATRIPAPPTVAFRQDIEITGTRKK